MTMAQLPKELILASASPRRADLLARMGLRFRIQATHVPEDDSGREGPEAMVLANARLKAATLAEEAPAALVLGSDTTVAIDGTVLSKPVDIEAAKAMLRRLSGRAHSVYTAVALQWSAGGLEHVFVERSRVLFRELSEAGIEAYLERINPLDKAGGYSIQESGAEIIASVEGSVENVMGLPIQRLAEVLRELEFDFYDKRA
jgi:septum formation protein